jgi:large subunit ribosomal protein L4
MAEMMETFDAAAYTANGTARERVPLPATLFDGTVHMPVMHQAVKAFLANQRQGTASTKTRGKVVGGNQKPWKQKGTGRARQGSTRAPHWVGGGTVFGPTPRGYTQKVPKQIKALARKSAFNARAREGAVVVVDRFDYDAPKTARLKALVDRLGLTGQKVLILTDGVKPNVFLSGRNLPTVHVMPYGDASTYHVLWSDIVVIESAALGTALEPIAESEPAPEAAPKAKRATTKKTTTKKASAKESSASAGKAVKKTAARKTAAEKEAKPAAKKAAKPAAKKATAKKKKGD